MRGGVTQQGGRRCEMFGENRSTCGKFHARWLFRLDAGGGRSSDHEEAERTPRQNSHV